MVTIYSWRDARRRRRSRLRAVNGAADQALEAESELAPEYEPPPDDADARDVGEDWGDRLEDEDL